MKHFFIIMFTGVLFNAHSAIPDLCVSGSCFHAQKRIYELKYKGIGSADAVLSTHFLATDSSLLVITLRVKTRPLVNLLFHVNNTYTTLVDTTTWRPVKLYKTIDQKNIKQTLTIDYDDNRLMAKTSHGFQYAIPHGCMTIFSLLFRLLNQPLEPGRPIEAYLDTENLLWRATGRMDDIQYAGDPCFNIAARKVEFNLFPVSNQEPRPWKTDLLTNRLGKPGATITFIFGPEPGRIPLCIQFGTDGNLVKMILKSCPEEYK